MNKGERERLDVGAHYRWVILGLGILTTATGLMVWASVFPLLPLWIEDLGISRAQGGLLFSLYFLPGLLVALPGGWLFDRFPLRRIFLCCWLLVVMGTLVMAFAPNFLTLCVGRFLFSVGMTVHQVGAPKLVAAWFEGRRELGLAMGLYTWGYTLGIFSSFILLGSVGEHYGWRGAMLLLVVFAVLSVLALALGLRPAPRFVTQTETAPVTFTPFRLGIPVWILALAWLFYNSSVDSYKTFTPDYLVGLGYSVSGASLLVSVYVWVAFLLKPLFAAFMKAGNAAYFLAVGGALACTAFSLQALESFHVLIPILLLGISIALATPSLLALPAFLLGSERSGQGYGLCQMFYSLGFFTAPLVGLTIDISTGHSWAFFLLTVYAGVSSACGVLLVWLVRRAATALVSPPPLMRVPGEDGT